jgi:outer membrane murein-binding lipoprotein Lpp
MLHKRQFPTMDEYPSPSFQSTEAGTPRSNNTTPSPSSRKSGSLYCTAPAAFYTPHGRSVSPDSGAHEPSLGQFSKSLSEWISANFSELLEHERQKADQRYNDKVDEMAKLQSKIDKLDALVRDLTTKVGELEEEKSQMESEMHLQDMEMVRKEAECESMKAFMKISLKL